MKKILQILIIFLLVSILDSCRESPCDISEYSIRIYSPVYADGFKILGAEGMKSTIISMSRPWQGAENEDRMLFIRRGGESVPEGFSGQVISGDAQRIVCMSSSYVAMLDAFSCADAVVGVSGLKYIFCDGIDKGRIVDVGYDENVDYELLVASAPDLVLLYGVYAESPLEKKLSQLGIPFMYVGDYLEEHPLGKAEWMVAIAEAMGRRDEAEKVFRPIAERYNALKQKVDTPLRPKVMLNTPYADVWFMPPAGSYMVRLIEDAGAEYVFKENTSSKSVAIDMEQAVRLSDSADFWLNASGFESIEELGARFPRFKASRPVVEGQVYNCDKRLNASNGNDFWESGVVCPDLVLADLIRIFHPELNLGGELYYYRKL